MSNLYALLSGGVVQNVVIWDGISTWAPPSGVTVIDVTSTPPIPGPGWLYSEGVFSAPPPSPTPVPQSVTRFQALAALTNAGLYAAAQAAATTAGGLTLLAWENAQSFDRSSPTIAAIATQLGMTSAQVDALFIAASQIQV